MAVHVRPAPSLAPSQGAEADLLAYILVELGARGLEWRDGPLEVVAAFELEPGEDSGALRARVRRGLDEGDVDASLAGVFPYPRVDWSTHWRRHFRPLQFGPLSIRPQWLPAPPGTGLVLYIDPSSAFGTGLHPTTALCLEWLVSMRPEEVLDVGTGTGILAMAALKLGARRAVGLDTDPEAIRVAADNRRRNGVPPEKLELSTDLVAERHGTFDAVVANILAEPLRRLAVDLSDRVGPSGHLVLSGLLREQVPDIRRAFEARGLVLEGEATRGEWARVGFKRG